jgi:hypothetical protein
MGRTAQPGEDSLTALGPAAQWVFSDSSFPTSYASVSLAIASLTLLFVSMRHTLCSGLHNTLKLDRNM